MKHPPSALAAVLFRDTEIGRMVAEINAAGASIRKMIEDLGASQHAAFVRAVNLQARQCCAVTQIGRLTHPGCRDRLRPYQLGGTPYLPTIASLTRNSKPKERVKVEPKEQLSDRHVARRTFNDLQPENR